MRLAVVDDEAIVQKRLKQALAKEYRQVETYSTGEDFLKVQSASPFDLVFLDVILPGMDGMEVLRHIKSQPVETEVILITGRASLNAAIEAVKQGAFHYLAKPLRTEEVRHLARKALEHRKLREENRRLRAQLRPLEGWGEMVGATLGMQKVFEIVRKVAPLDCPVLITGESGTGKELVARAIHRESQRKDKPFIAFNCAGFTEELIASELFGYERGAFTGAVATKIGLLENAHPGTVFMDEIGDMPPSMQAKLLRVIQEGQIFRVGGNRPIRLDLRFIAASNKDLKREIQAGRFREDLYFRLNVVQINLPALRDRPEDIPLLLQYFLAKYNRKFAKRVKGIETQAREALLAYSYPGNVRELENIIERAVALAEGEVLTLADLPGDLQEYSVTPYQEFPPLEQQEREYIRKVLAYTHYHVSQAAQILNLPRTTLWRKMKKYGLAKTTFPGT
ncbi:MAG: sigma-54-dependent Fis family transcriptional regulator [Deltaproteobacteria bacterium]|nr:sigma-54-dependent Fis family transcriptional regulator [Deltaproteobacteria bacterium]